MDFDDDAPPELVSTAGPEEDEEITVKVPITIVTGMDSDVAHGKRFISDNI